MKLLLLQATYAKLLWNAPGTGVLALTATETDATNQSYYGEQKLSFLSADGTNDCIVQLKVFPTCFHALALFIIYSPR
jgi:translation initiation factor 2A